MTFEVATDREAPEFTTTAKYCLQRVATPTLTGTFMETVYDTDDLPVLAASKSVPEGQFDRLVFAALAPNSPAMSDPLTATLMPKRHIAIDGVELGLVAGFDPATGTVALTTGLAEDPTAKTANIRKVNPFGIDVQRAARNGRGSYDVTLNSGKEEDRNYMNTMLGTITVKLVMAVLLQAGAGTPAVDMATVAAAVTALAVGGVNIDSIISESMEQMEKDRRAGVIHPAVMGNAPAPDPD